MPGIRCSVVYCKNKRLKHKIVPPTRDVRYHKFPKDSTLRHKWILYSGRNITWNPTSAVICSDHFTPNDYERDLKSELLNLKPRKKLKPNSFPTVPKPPPTLAVNDSKRPPLKKADEKSMSLRNKARIKSSSTKIIWKPRIKLVSTNTVGTRSKSKINRAQRARILKMAAAKKAAAVVSKAHSSIKSKSCAKREPTTKKNLKEHSRKQLKVSDELPISDMNIETAELESDCEILQPSAESFIKARTNSEAENNSTVSEPSVDILVNSTTKVHEVDEVLSLKTENYNLTLQYMRLKGTLQLEIHEKSILLTKLKRAHEDIDFKNKIIQSQNKRFQILKKKLKALEEKLLTS